MKYNVSIRPIPYSQITKTYRIKIFHQWISINPSGFNEHITSIQLVTLERHCWLMLALLLCILLGRNQCPSITVVARRAWRFVSVWFVCGEWAVLCWCRSQLWVDARYLLIIRNFVENINWSGSICRYFSGLFYFSQG